MSALRLRVLGHVGEALRADEPQCRGGFRRDAELRSRSSSATGERGRRAARAQARARPRRSRQGRAPGCRAPVARAPTARTRRSSAAVSASLAPGTVRAALTSNSASARSAPGPRSSRSASRTRSASSASSSLRPDASTASTWRPTSARRRARSAARPTAAKTAARVAASSRVAGLVDCTTATRRPAIVTGVASRPFDGSASAAAEVVDGRPPEPVANPTSSPGRRAGHGGRHAASGPCRSRATARSASDAGAANIAPEVSRIPASATATA